MTVEATGDRHPKIRGLHDYWRGIQPGADRLPGRQHLEPMRIPALLPWLWVVDVEREPLRFRYRLLGTVHVAAMERELPGRYLDEVHPSFLSDSVYPHYADIVCDKQPRYRKGRPGFHVNKDFLTMERIMLPMARDGDTVDMIVALTVYFRRDGSEAYG